MKYAIGWRKANEKLIEWLCPEWKWFSIFGIIFLVLFAVGLTMTDFNSEPIRPVRAEVIVETPAAPEVKIKGSVESQIREVAERMNFKWTDYLIKLAFCESSFRPAVTNFYGNSPRISQDRGLFQFNSYYHPEISNDCAFSVECSTEKAIEMINAGKQKEWACDSLI